VRRDPTSTENRRKSNWPLRIVGAVLGLLALGGAAAAAVATYHQAQSALVRVRVGNGADESRMVIELDNPTSAQLAGAAAASDHLVLALPNVRSETDQHGSSDGLLRQWHVEQAAGAARLELSFNRPAVVKRRFLLPPDDGVKVYRYVIDFAPADAAPAPLPPIGGKALASNAPSKPAKTLITATRTPIAARKVIVIDAGHGGKDPGASGASSREKDVTLAAAHALRERLEATGRYQVVMTRAEDVFIPLEQRVQVARREGADLFISLHADSIADPSLHGATVYTLSDKGADRVAHRVFDKSDWFINVALPGRDPSVNRILLDLTQRETTNQSSGFANLLLDRLNGNVDLLRRSHRDANYVVLLAPDVPAILLEMGFITNPLDEKRLASADSRKALADAVASAIDAYFTRQTRMALR
jgi:N-acetylmuramoyl-L-alanine amidase